MSFETSRGGEIRKERPAVIVSNGAANRNLNRVQVVPVTSNVSRVYPSEALVTVQAKPNKAMADQITTVAKERLLRKAGALSADEVHDVERAIRVQLGLTTPR